MTLARVLREGAIQDQAEALMKRYAPGVRLDSRILGGRLTGAWYDAHDKGGPVIKWPIADGLTVLLHEIAHFKFDHRTERCCRGHDLLDELKAWLWAEREAKKLGVTFDYELADHYFGRKPYNRWKVGINWRYKNGK